MGDLEISHRVHVTSGRPDRSVTLPDLPGSEPHSAPMLDRVGQAVQGGWPLVAGGAIGGGAIGSKLLRGAGGGGGIVRGIVGGLAGVLAGTAIVTGGLALLRGGEAGRTPSAPATPQAPRTGVGARERVTVMTWNLHGGMGGPGEFRSSDEELDALADTIRREQPDVLLLQEVDDFSIRSSMKDVLAELDERLDPTSSVGGAPGTSILGRDQHVAVMTFNGFEVTDARNLIHQDPRGGGVAVRAGDFANELAGFADGVLGTDWKDPTRDYVRRNTLEAMVRTPEGSHVRVLSGHYEWSNPRFDTQDAEVGSIARGLDAWRGPTIWGGDFNVRDGSSQGSRERRYMEQAGLRDTLDGVPQHEKVTMTELAASGDPAAGRAGGIDRIYASGHARVLDSRVAVEAGDRSDHLPLVTELELTPSAVDTAREAR